jgi:hypothetical protein
MTLGKYRVFLTILVFSQGASLHLALGRDDLVPGSRYTSARAAAMGDAFLPLGEDVASGLFYNPGNLAKIRLMEYNISNFTLDLNTPFVSNLGLGSVSLPILGSFLPTLTTVSPKFLGGGGSFFMDFGMPGFSVGVLLQSQIGAQLNADSTVTYRSLYQLIPAVGTGFKLFRGLIRFGYSLQWVNQAVGNVTTASSTSLAYTDGIAQGSAISHNLGVGVTLPFRLVPTFDLVVRNAMGANYISPVIYPFTSSSTSVPVTEAMTFDGSFSLQPHLGRVTILNIVGVYRDILNQSQDSVLGRIALGAEIAVRRRFFFRAGFSGGYPSAGFGLKAGKRELSFAWYTTEIGTSFMSQGDTRFMMQYQIGSF